MSIRRLTAEDGNEHRLTDADNKKLGFANQGVSGKKTYPKIAIGIVTMASMMNNHLREGCQQLQSLGHRKDGIPPTSQTMNFVEMGISGGLQEL